MDMSELFTAQVRSLQAIYPQAHAQLLNWGAWSRDRAGIGPTRYPPPNPIFAAIDRGEWDKDGYGEEVLDWTPPQGEVKAERAEDEPYDEKTADELDEALHARFPYPIRKCLLVAYVTREVRECDFPRLAKCEHDEFLQRLEAVLGAL